MFHDEKMEIWKVQQGITKIAQKIHQTNSPPQKSAFSCTTVHPRSTTIEQAEPKRTRSNRQISADDLMLMNSKVRRAKREAKKFKNQMKTRKFVSKIVMAAVAMAGELVERIGKCRKKLTGSLALCALRSDSLVVSRG